MKKIKILYILDKIDYNSGVSSIAMNYFRNINNKDIRIDFIVYKEINKVILEDIHKKGSKVYVLPDLTLLTLHIFKKRICKIFEKNTYDIIHCHLPHRAIFFLKIAKKYGIKNRVIHSHNSKGGDNWFRIAINTILTKAGLRFATDYFACSSLAGNYAFGKYIKYHIIPNAINTKRFFFDQKMREESRHTFSLENKFVIGHVGRYEKQKNHKFILQVFQKVLEKNKDSILMLIGTGSLLNHIKDEARSRNLYQHIIFLNHISDIERYFNMMDLFILPSFYEGLPVVCVEAQANSLPCFISNHITKEVILTNHIKPLDIKNIEQWVKTILFYKEHFERTEKNIENVIRYYDITKESEKLLSKYQFMCENK